MKQVKLRHLYQTEKWKYDPHTRGYSQLISEEGYLFANGVYPTHLKPEDLPEWYVPGIYRKSFGYLSAKEVRFMVYVPNMDVNHMFKDDVLYISYENEIRREMDKRPRYIGYDIAINGEVIVSFLKAAEKYSGYDIHRIKEQIEEKRHWFRTTYPEFYVLEVPDDKSFFGQE